MSETTGTTKVRRTPEQTARDALIAADDRVARAAKRVEKAKTEVEKAEAEHKRVVAVRNYAAQHPDLLPENEPGDDEAPGDGALSIVV